MDRKHFVFVSSRYLIVFVDFLSIILSTYSLANTFRELYVYNAQKMRYGLEFDSLIFVLNLFEYDWLKSRK